MPRLDLSPGDLAKQSFKVRQKWEEWVTHVGIVLATWHNTAVDLWNQHLSRAKKLHLDWQAKTSIEKLEYESRFIYGLARPMPVSSTVLEDTL